MSGAQFCSRCIPSVEARAGLHDCTGVTANELVAQNAAQAAVIIFIFIITSKKRVEKFHFRRTEVLAVFMTFITKMVNLHLRFGVIALL
jgi:hypothetical protein